MKTYTKEDLEGMQFCHKNSKTLYTITSQENEKYLLTWGKDRKANNYTASFILGYLNTKTWLPIKNTQTEPNYSPF